MLIAKLSETVLGAAGNSSVQIMPKVSKSQNTTGPRVLDVGSR